MFVPSVDGTHIADSGGNSKLCLLQFFAFAAEDIEITYPQALWIKIG